MHVTAAAWVEQEGEAEAKAEPAADSAEAKLAKAEETVQTLEEEKKELRHK